jgi:hypothetical protein
MWSVPDLKHLYRALHILINCFFKQVGDILTLLQKEMYYVREYTPYESRWLILRIYSWSVFSITYRYLHKKCLFFWQIRINKNKTIHFYWHTYFRLSNVDLWFDWFVITCGRFQIWNTCIVPCFNLMQLSLIKFIILINRLMKI